MNTGTKGLLALLAIFALGAWFVRQRSAGRGAEVAHLSPEPARAEPDSALLADAPESVERELVAPGRVEPLAPEPAPAEAPEAQGAAPGPEAGERSELRELLTDPAFRAACERPTETATETLKALVARADQVCLSLREEVAQARIEAGLFERIPGYVPGQEVKWPEEDGLLRTFVGTETGDAGWVVLERVDPPELYTLVDHLVLLRQELRSRERRR